MSRQLPLTIVKQYSLPFAVSSLSGIVAAVILLMLIQTSFLKIPAQGGHRQSLAKPLQGKADQEAQDNGYAIIEERNLFRARLKIEIPKPKSEQQLEEEALTNIMRPMILKGIWMGQKKDDIYAVVDKGPQKGVWIYRVGDVADRGLVVSEINQNNVVFKKNDFVASLRLFTKGFERAHTPKLNPPPPPAKIPDKPKSPPKKGPA
jgi:hypothetical protein